MNRPVRALLLSGSALVAFAGHAHAGSHIVGSGKPRTERREVARFSAITAQGGVAVDVTVGPAPSLTVTGDDNVVPVIRTEVHGDRLVIDQREGYSSKQRPRVTITLPDLTAVSAQGGTTIAITGAHGDRLALDASAGGAIHAAGKVATLTATARDGGRLAARDLAATNARVDAAGAGAVELTASSSLTALATGASHVAYWGHPATVERMTTQAASLTAR
jgi:Putative auto-transporter adhesin, head GIN domain